MRDPPTVPYGRENIITTQRVAPRIGRAEIQRAGFKVGLPRNPSRLFRHSPLLILPSSSAPKAPWAWVTLLAHMPTQFMAARYR